MKKVLLFLITVLVFLPWNSLADGNESLLEQANTLYTEGNYKEAILSYEQILQTGQESAQVHYNLGNAYFKTNQLKLAILNYERGSLLSPGDEDIKYNLSIANELITDRIEALPEFFFKSWYKSLKVILPSNSWALMSILSFGIAGIFAILFIALRKRGWRKVSLISAIAGILISAFSLLFAFQQGKQLSNRNTCIVFAPTVTIKSSPDDSGTNLFVLHEGVKLLIIDQLSAWYEIKLADGNVGWIPIEAVEII